MPICVPDNTFRVSEYQDFGRFHEFK